MGKCLEQLTVALQKYSTQAPGGGRACIITPDYCDLEWYGYQWIDSWLDRTDTDTICFEVRMNKVASLGGLDEDTDDQALIQDYNDELIYAARRTWEEGLDVDTDCIVFWCVLEAEAQWVYKDGELDMDLTARSVLAGAYDVMGPRIAWLAEFENQWTIIDYKYTILAEGGTYEGHS